MRNEVELGSSGYQHHTMIFKNIFGNGPFNIFRLFLEIYFCHMKDNLNQNFYKFPSPDSLLHTTNEYLLDN